MHPEINQAIISAEGDALALLDVTAQHVGGFDKVNCATMINRLSRVAAALSPPSYRSKQGKGRGRKDEQQYLLSLLYDRTAALLPDCDARQLANIMNGLGKLHVNPSSLSPSFLTSFAQGVEREGGWEGRAGGFSIQEVTNTLTGVSYIFPGAFGSKGGGGGERGGMRKGGREGGRGTGGWSEVDSIVQTLTEQALPRVIQDATSQHVANIMNALARLEYHPRSPTLIPSLLVQGLATVETAMPQHIANSLNGLARLGGEGKGEERDTFIQACINVTLSTGFSRFEARDVSSMLNSMVRIGGVEEKYAQLPAFLSRARARVLVVLGRANSQDISLILNALSRIGLSHAGQKQEEFVLTLLHQLLSAPHLNNSLTPQGVATIINAASKLLSSPSSPATILKAHHLYRPLMLRACDLLQGMDSQGLSLTIAGLGKLSRGRSGTREPILSRFLAVSSPFLASFTPQHLSVSVHGISLFDRPPPTEYMERVQEAVLPHLSSFTLQQLALTLHGMAKLGHHPGDLFLSAFLPAVQQRLAPPVPGRGGGGGGGAKPSLPRPEPGNNLPQNLSLVLVALAVLQYIPSSSFWEAFTQALLSLTNLPPPPPPAATAAAAAGGQAANQPSLPRSLRLIDVSSCLWALAALDFPPSLPPTLLSALLGRLEALLEAGEEVELEAAKQLKQFALAVDLSHSPFPFLPSSLPTWSSLRGLIETKAWLPHAQEEYCRSDEEGEDRDGIITSPIQLEVEHVLRELGFPCKGEVHWGPFSLDLLVFPPPPHEGGATSSSPPSSSSSSKLALPLVLEVDGASHFFQNLNPRTPRGHTVLKRRILEGLVGKLWGGVVVLTTEEWNVCESDNPALSYSPSDYTHNLQRDSEEEHVRKKMLLKEKVKEAFLGGRR
ncbi:type iii effector protein [Nannochloropsis oceanica]